MKLFGFASPLTASDALFYVQASTRPQANFILETVLKSKLSGKCQMIDAATETIIPTCSRKELSLVPWENNRHAVSQQLIMKTHGLTLTGAVYANQTRQIVEFCDDLGLTLQEDSQTTPWATRINSDCANLNPPRLYPVLLDPGTNVQFQVFVTAPATGDPEDVIEDVIQEYFGNITGYQTLDARLSLNSRPVISLESHRTDTGISVFELSFCSQGLTLSSIINKSELRHVVLMCEAFGVQLQGRAGASCHGYMRHELRLLAQVGVYSRAGAENDVREYTSYTEKMLIQNLLEQANRCDGLIPARHGLPFNGVLFNATPSSATTGFVYLSPDFPEGQFMMTAEVVKVGTTEQGISYIETVDGFRFIVTAYGTNEMHSLTRFIEVNEEYYSHYRWS
ncbi:flavin reductase [Salmonella enterica]|nr:flavin reductase [Salmonella enterica]